MALIFISHSSSDNAVAAELTPAQIRQRIVDAAQPGPIAGDPDAFPEGVLDISTF